jgi:hypothetical protein
MQKQLVQAAAIDEIRSINFLNDVKTILLIFYSIAHNGIICIFIDHHGFGGTAGK